LCNVSNGCNVTTQLENMNRSYYRYLHVYHRNKEF